MAEKPKTLVERIPNLQPEPLPDGTVVYIKPAEALGPLLGAKSTKAWMRAHQLMKEQVASYNLDDLPDEGEEVDHIEEIARLIDDLLLMVVIGPEESLLGLDDSFKWLLVHKAMSADTSAEGEVEETAPNRKARRSQSRRPSQKSQGSTEATG